MNIITICIIKILLRYNSFRLLIWLTWLRYSHPFSLTPQSSKLYQFYLAIVFNWWESSLWTNALFPCCLFYSNLSITIITKIDIFDVFYVGSFGEILDSFLSDVVATSTNYKILNLIFAPFHWMHFDNYLHPLSPILLPAKYSYFYQDWLLVVLPLWFICSGCILLWQPLSPPMKWYPFYLC